MLPSDVAPARGAVAAKSTESLSSLKICYVAAYYPAT